MAVPISNVTRRQVYAPSGAGGAGPYAFTFEVLANTDIAVFKDDALLTLTTHYTVTINANGTGSVTITAAGLALEPASPTQYAIVGNRTIARTTDFTTGGDFFANTLNDELDQQTIFAQQNAEGIVRSLAAPQTDPTSINMTLPRAALRANKALGFDASGNPVISDTLGTNRGNWAAGVLYYVRDIAKDTTTNNIFQVITQHTSSGSQPITTNADSAKWTLLVDAASATTSATNAAASASAASTSAGNASTSASNASTSASNASTSASSAASSASAASTSAANAATSYDSFDDRYLGAKASAPTLDNDGNALLTGALYWDTGLNQMRVWSGTAWANVNASASNTRTAITATAGQTVLTVATYTPGTNTMVLYVNGVKLNASEYAETNATTVTLTTGLSLNDEVEVYSYRVNDIGTLGASSVTIADTGNYYAGGNAEVALQEAASFTQAGSGAVTRSKNSKLQETVSVKDFGAIGDGVADDTNEIQYAVDSGAKRIRLPGGPYKITNTITLPPNVTLIGDGINATNVVIAADVVGFVIQYYSKLQGFKLTKSGAHTKNGINVGSTTLDAGRSVLQDLWVDGVGNDGIQVRQGNLGTIRDVVCTSNGRDGINFTTETTDANAWKLEGFIDARGNTRDGVHFQQGAGAAVLAAPKSNSADLIVAQQNGRYGLYCGTRSNSFVVYAELNTSSDVYLDTYAYGNVVTLVESQTYTDNGQRNLFSTHNADADYFRAYKGKVQFQGGAGKGIRIDSTDGTAGRLDIEKTGLRAFAAIAGGSSANQTTTFKHEDDPTYKHHLAATGNFVVASGQGVDFSAGANAAGMTDELLNDYEQGAWTPVLTFNGNSVGITYATQRGRYTKVGRAVTVHFEISLTSKGSSTGECWINGLPFASGQIEAMPVYLYSNFNAVYKVGVMYVSASTIWELAANGTSFFTDTQFTNTSRFWGTCTYQV